MKSAQRRPQYLDMLPLTHYDDLASTSVQSGGRPWRLIVALVLLLAVLLSLTLSGVVQ